MELIRRVEDKINKERWFDPGERIVVAVSGGPDSVALLHLLFLLSKRHGWKLLVGHVNHQFREESEEEAEFVQEWAASLGLPCKVGVINVPRYIEETGDNPQNAAREQRYRFLTSIAREFGAHKLALGHHADDQAETVLMRLIRGTGPSGLAGIPAANTMDGVQRIRPLLEVYKAELVNYCTEHQLTYYVDRSNEERKYARNRVRLDVIPELTKYNPQFVESLNRLSLMIREEDDYMDRETAAAYKRIVRSTPENGEISFSRKEFISLHVALQRRLIKLILNYLNFCADSVEFTGVELLREAILQERSSTLTLEAGDRIRFFKEYDRIGFVRNYSPSRPFHYPVELNRSSLYLPESGMSMEYFITRSCEDCHGFGQRTRDCAMFDLDLLELPLTVRSRLAGDRMQVLGLNGSKKVKDIFIDAKISPRERDRVPLVVDGAGRIIWIPGIKRSEHAVVTNRTARYLYMKVTREST